MQNELKVLENTLRTQCPELLDFLAPGIDESAFPHDIILSRDLLALYQWSSGVYTTQVLQSQREIPAYNLFYSHNFGDPVELSLETRIQFFDDGAYFCVLEDNFGDYFFVKADGSSERLYFLRAGSETPIPAFSSVTTLIRTINHLFETGNATYKVDGRHKKLIVSEQAWEIARAMNESLESREYWSEGFH